MTLPSTPENILLAARAIAEGNLVGLPTETVYGIAADAFQPRSIERVFELKGRPLENPLIVHLADVADLSRVALEIPAVARELASAFWPGPLTVVLRKRPEVPDIVTGGLSTVAVRVPAHPVARSVIEASGTVAAAPSANKFMGLSPTTASDIDTEVEAGLAMVLDGGRCEIGIESTVIDLSGTEPRLLRPGHLSRAALETIIGPLSLEARADIRSSPGMYSRHYAPRARLVLVKRARVNAAALVLGSPGSARQIEMPTEPAAYAAELYAALHEMDRRCEPSIEVEEPPAEWEAVWDRLRKASAPLEGGP